LFLVFLFASSVNYDNSTIIHDIHFKIIIVKHNNKIVISSVKINMDRGPINMSRLQITYSVIKNNVIISLMR